MLLTVADTPYKVEQLRKTFAQLRYFTYCATKETMLSCAKRYAPHAICLKTDEITERLKKDLEEIKSAFPSLAVILITDCVGHSLPADILLPKDAPVTHIFFHVLYYMPAKAYSSPLLRQNLLIKGMLFNTYMCHVRIYGWVIRFTGEDVFLLRYLAEIYPRRASIDELAELCFAYGKKASTATVRSRISRINQRAVNSLKALTRPVVTYKASDGGYQIDF